MLLEIVEHRLGITGIDHIMTAAVFSMNQPDIVVVEGGMGVTVCILVSHRDWVTRI